MILLKASTRFAAVLFLFSLLLSGCADHVTERSGTQIDVIPVTYSLSLKIVPKQSQSAQQALNRFLLDNKKIVLTQNIELIWKSKLGKSWADKTKAQLLNEGVNNKNIRITQEKSDVNARFDYQIKITVHKVLLSVCEYPTSSRYSDTLGGCYSESARWQSMVHPEKMLEQSYNDNHINKE